MGCISGTIFGCTVAAALTSGGTYDANLPTTATSYDGVERDVSQFYTPESPTWNAQGYIAFDNTLIQLGYDSGIDTAKYDVGHSLSVHVTQVFELNEKLSISTTLGTKFGGEQRDTPCYDEAGRRYYCGNLTAWSDYERNDHEKYSMGRVALRYRF